MPKGVWVRTEEYRRKMSRILKGNGKGRKFSAEHRRKIAEASSRHRHSEATKRKISLAKKGRKRPIEAVRKTADALRGRPCSETRKRNISKALKGRKFTAEHKRKLSEGRRGMKLSEKHRKNISKANSGSGNHFWRGGLTKKLYAPTWTTALRQKIRQRDNYTCQECGYTQEQLGRKLAVHHIDYDKTNNNPDNLISLCRFCHAKTGFDRTEWIKYYQKKVKHGSMYI